MLPKRDNIKGARGKAELTPHRTIHHSRWHTRLMLFFMSTLLCIVSAEVAARAFWFLCYDMSFRNPDRILQAYYPELMKVYTQRPARDDEFYDILLLSGSALHSDWGKVEQELREQLAYNGHRNARIFNLAMSAHTSRDSWLKYAALGDARFELVVFYHGINDSRANNVRPEIFREDYAHYSWYKTVNTLASYHGTSSFALPYTLHWLVIRIEYVLTKDRYVPMHSPREDWVHYGRVSRSSVSFRHNLSAIYDLASGRGDQMLLMTYAIYVPENYSREAFKEKRLDYGLHLFPIEIYGAREHVLETVAVHNDIVRRLTAQHDDVLFVDQASLMAGNPRYFNDPCHLTTLGSAKLVENMLRVLLPRH